MSSAARFHLPAAPVEWSRRRLQILLVSGVALSLALLAGGIWSLASIGRTTGSQQATPFRAHASSPVDRLAEASLPTAGIELAQPGPLSAGVAGTISLPRPRGLGPVQVPTGFPHSAEGAMAQLVAIDQRALESTSVVIAQDVIDGWAQPGGPTARGWSGVRALVALLSSAGLPADGSGALSVGLRPAMGFIKGRVGLDFVVPCVDFMATITPVNSTVARVAVADCQRMVWGADRWWIGAGDEPASPPSIWPGSRASYEAGYQWLAVSP